MKHALVLLLTVLALTAPAAERVLAYRVVRIDPAAAPTLDGRLDEEVWQGRPRITALRQFLGPQKGELPTQLSAFTVLTDGRQLYVGAVFREDQMAKLRANPATTPFGNDCIEVYFDPQRTRTRSIQLVVDCLGRRWWQKSVDDGYGWFGDSAWYMLADWAARAVRDEEQWSVELRIDAASFGIDVSPGAMCSFNTCRFRFGAGQELSAWGYGPRGNQKDMTTWGTLLFMPPGGDVTGALSAADIATIFPHPWGDRVFELPAAGGMALFSEAGESFRSYPDLLAEVAARTRELVAEADLQDEKLRREATAALAELAAPEWTLGRYERTRDALLRLNQRLNAAIWRERLAALVAETHAQ